MIQGQLFADTFERQAFRPRPGFESDEEYTPQWLIDLIENFQGETETDPCWSPHSFVRPQAYAWQWHQDGLTRDWFGSILMNMPYSKPGPWIRRALEHHHRTGAPVTIIARADSTTKAHDGIRWSTRDVKGAYQVDLTSRVVFHAPFSDRKPTAAKFNSRLYVLSKRKRDAAAIRCFGVVGDVNPIGGMR